MGNHIPFAYSDEILSRVIASTFVREPGRFSPQYKWHRELLSIVKDSLRPERILPTGSWAHDTAIAGNSDRDYFLVLPGAAAGRPSALLDRLYADLSSAVSAATEVYLDSPAVGVIDPYSQLGVEFVPAFRENAADYLIPDASGSSWMLTDPVAHVTYLGRARSATGDARNAIRMMKPWKIHALPGLSSLYLEMVTAKYYVENPNVPYLETLTGVLTVLTQRRLEDIPDPSLEHLRLVTAFSDPTVVVAEALKRVNGSRDLGFRIDAAERSRAFEDVEAFVNELFGPRAAPQGSSATPPRTRRDPNRVQFRGILKGVDGHAGRVRKPRGR